MKYKKILSCVLAAAMAVSTFPVITASADTSTPTPITLTEQSTEGGRLTITLKIKQSITPTVTLADWSYGDTANTPVVTGNSGNGTVTYQYKVKGADDSTYSETVPTAVGQYTVKADIAETDEYKAGEATADFEIKPMTKGLTITLTIGEGKGKVASGNAYVGKSDKINISNLIGSGTPGEISITDAYSILADNGVTLDANGDLTYSFIDDSTNANKTATVRIPVTGNGDQYAIVVTLTMLKTPEPSGTDSDTVTWDTPKDTENKNDTLTVKSDSTNSNKPTVSENNDISLTGKSSLTIAETNNSGSNAAVIESVSGGSITVNTNTDIYDAITLTGEDSTFKLGSNAVEKLEANETATISYDGKYAKVENTSTKEITFFEANKKASVVIDSLTDALNTTKTDTPTEDDAVKIKAFEVLDTVTKNTLSDKEKINVPDSGSYQLMTVNVWATNDNGVTEKLSHIKVKDSSKKIKLRIPLTTVIDKAVLRHINKDTGALEYVKSEVKNDGNNNYFIETETDSLSSWIYTPATGLTITKADATNGSFTVKVNGTEALTANSGDTITIEDEPATGYKLSSLKFEGDVSGATLITSSKTFIMPGEDVTINAVFTKISSGGGSYIDYTTKTINGVNYHVHPKYVGVYEGDKEIEDVVILSEVDGLPVTTIEAGAFNSFKNMKTIELPDTLTTIEQGAFWGCSALEEIDIPESVTSIGSNAFSHCTNLKKVIIRNKNSTIYQTKETISNEYVSSSMGYTYTGTIYGYTGSTAESYANRFKYTFEDIEKLVPVLGIAEAPTVDSEGVVHWNAVENAVKYRIVKEYGGKTYFGKETTETSYQQNNTKVDVEHTIFIRSFDESGNYTDGAVLTIPAKLGTAKVPTVDSEGVVSWSAVKNAVSYKIVKEYGGKTYLGKETTETSYKQNNVVAVEYKVYIRAFGKDGSYTDGEVTTITEKTLGKVAAPTVAEDGTVTWTAAKNAVKYKVVKIVNGVYYGGSVVTGTSYKFKNVPVSDYKVYVIAYGEDNAKTIGNKTTVEVDNSLGYVNDVKVDKNGKVTWTKADNATSYRVVKIVGGNKYYCKETKNTNYTFAVKPIRDYQVYVIAYNANKKYTAGKSMTVEVGTLGTVLDPKVDKNGTVTWTAARNAVKYKIGKTVNGKTYYSGDITGTSYTFKNVATKDYKVFVVAFDKDGNKTWGWKVDVKVS